MKFYCFPRKQKIYLIYSSYRIFQTKLFQQLIIQSSPKNSIFYRFMKTKFGFMISFIFKSEFEVPKDNCDYIGIIKNNTKILFEINDKSTWVWKKKENDIWEREPFLGNQLISEYSLKEIDSKYQLIENALQIHWNYLQNKTSRIHGDFTHFNILYDEGGEIHFIDQKSHENSILYDFYYFYAYLKQCIQRCSTLSVLEKNKMIYRIESILKKVCKYDSIEKFNDDCKNIQNPKVCGLLSKNKDTFLADFINIFKNDEIDSTVLPI